MNEYLRQITRLLKINGDSMEGMMVVNRDGIIEYYKASSALEKLPDDFGRQVRGKHLLEVYPDLSEETSTVIRTLRTGTITVGEKQVLTSGNFKLTMTTTTYPIMGEDGSIQGAVDIAQLLDISERGTSRPVQYGQSTLDDTPLLSPFGLGAEHHVGSSDFEAVGVHALPHVENLCLLVGVKV